MMNGPLIAILGGARETARAVEWLARAGARGVVIWDADNEPADFEFDAAAREVLSCAAGLLDASHAFAEAPRRAAVALAPGVPYARVGRAEWVPTPQDNWTQVDTLDDAVAALPAGGRVFAATGRGSLNALARHDGPVFVRQLSRHDLPMPLANGQFVFGTAPFSVASEVALFRKLEIDVVLARNIGGAGSFPKLAAARELNMPAVLLSAPALPNGPHLASFDDVKSWIATL